MIFNQSAFCNAIWKIAQLNNIYSGQINLIENAGRLLDSHFIRNWVIDETNCRMRDTIKNKMSESNNSIPPSANEIVSCQFEVRSNRMSAEC